MRAAQIWKRMVIGDGEELNAWPKLREIQDAQVEQHTGTETEHLSLSMKLRRFNCDRGALPILESALDRGVIPLIPQP